MRLSSKAIGRSSTAAKGRFHREELRTHSNGILMAREIRNTLALYRLFVLIEQLGDQHHLRRLGMVP